MRLENSEEICKIRGFNLTSQGAQNVLNHETMRDFILDWTQKGQKRSIDSKHFQMKVNRREVTVKNTTVTKTYRNDTFNKRVFLDNSKHNRFLSTVPYGTKHLKFADIPEEYLEY